LVIFVGHYSLCAFELGRHGAIGGAATSPTSDVQVAAVAVAEPTRRAGCSIPIAKIIIGVGGNWRGIDEQKSISYFSPFRSRSPCAGRLALHDRWQSCDL
jgi:hypothetical protein